MTLCESIINKYWEGYKRKIRVMRSLVKKAEADPTLDTKDTSHAVKQHKRSVLNSWKRFNKNKEGTKVHLDDKVLSHSPLEKQKKYVSDKIQSLYAGKNGKTVWGYKTTPKEAIKLINKYNDIRKTISDHGHDPHMALNGTDGKGVYFNFDPYFDQNPPPKSKNKTTIDHDSSNKASSWAGGTAVTRKDVEKYRNRVMFEQPKNYKEDERGLKTSLDHMYGGNVNHRIFKGLVYVNPTKDIGSRKKINGTQIAPFDSTIQHEVGHVRNMPDKINSDSEEAADIQSIRKNKMSLSDYKAHVKLLQGDDFYERPPSKEIHAVARRKLSQEDKIQKIHSGDYDNLFKDRNFDSHGNYTGHDNSNPKNRKN